MVNAGHAFKGSRIGSGYSLPASGRHLDAERAQGLVDRTVVSYWCLEGHETRPTFAKLSEAEIPEVWECGRCGRPAGRSPGMDLNTDGDEPFKSHLQYVKERRTEAEAKKVLENALAQLRQRHSV
ncbi:RNA polymerase-binding protein RbpA [Arthrobacter parietis]|uniref:RNA polymerase-binding protein RbpA n=2 Tax=Arthrobacter TaxID=1663 RepID=A0ABT6CSD9_9MICC|nr:RNA polymerase-binding protein RbpA [Arthrobacter vasquezii]MDF9276510.1 RNA polymerase-binding protein RbpA [Arthrobacter vasquezii]